MSDSVGYGVGIIRIGKFPVQYRPESTRKSGKVKPLVPDYSSVLGEMGRTKGDEPHIVGPRQAHLLYGRPPSDIAAQIRGELELARDCRGRRINPQTTVLLAGIASFPATTDEVRANPALRESFRTWCGLVLKFLTAEFGGRLDTVVLHLDENQPHVHFACAARLLMGERSASGIHPGVAARPTEIAARAKSGRDWKGQKFSFAAGNRAFLDRYFMQVSAPVGHARFGGRVASLGRKEWQKQRKQREALKHALDEAKRVRTEIDQARHEFERERQAQAEILAALKHKIERSRARIARIQKRARENFQIRARLRIALRWASAHGVNVPQHVLEAAGLPDAGSAQP